jgi:predicted HTH transcriptional regulator
MVHRINNDTDLYTVLAHGENEFIEFKTAIPRPEIVARNIAAFSNASGGTVLFGIREDGSVAGADLHRVQDALERAQISLSPSPITVTYEIPYQGKNVVAVDVEPSVSGPVLSQGAAVMRVGSSIRPITPDRVVSFLPTYELSASKISDGIKQLAETVSKQSEIIDALRAEMAAANKWRRKLPDWIWGGLVGAIIGLILATILGVG